MIRMVAVDCLYLECMGDATLEKRYVVVDPEPSDTYGSR